MSEECINHRKFIQVSAEMKRSKLPSRWSRDEEKAMGVKEIKQAVLGVCACTGMQTLVCSFTPHYQIYSLSCKLV